MTAFAHNAPIGEFIAWLRDWAIRQGANYLLIDKVDQLAELDEIQDQSDRITELETRRDDLRYALEDLIPYVNTADEAAMEAVTLARRAMEDAK